MDEKTSVVLIQALADVWTAIRERHPDVPGVVLLPAPAGGRANVLGHFAPLRWSPKTQEDGELLHEVVVVAEHLNRPTADIVETLVHEAAHALNFNRGVRDCSRNQYHNRKFRDAAQELGFTLANAITYVQAATERGLEVDRFAPRLAFFFNVHNNFLEEVAKFRAARRLWARIMKERFKATDPRSWRLRFHTQTAGSTLTAQQPRVNLVRVALQALASVLGGTQSLHTNSYDEALGLPTTESALLALRTQQVIGHETGVDAFVDPLGGSYAVERLTDELEEKASDYIRRIDDMGGMVHAISAGFPQREILETAYRYQLSLEEQERIVVGVNRFEVKEEEATPVLRINPAVEEAQRARTASVRRERSSRDASAALKALTAAARGSDNLLPLVLSCVRARCTLGEISAAMEEVFSRHVETMVI